MSKRWPELTDAGHLERLKAKCDISANGCWELRYAPKKSKGMERLLKGYGDFCYRGIRTTAHRAAYTLAKGPIPEGFVVAHSCDNPPCCNPDHLRACTEKENMQEAGAKKRWPRQYRDTCVNGHPRTPESMVWHGSEKKLRCRVCLRAKWLRQSLRKSEANAQRTGE